VSGLLVAVEGPKFVGKTLLVSQLKTRMSHTADWVFTKEPTDAFDLDNEQRHVGVTLAALIAQDRAKHVAEVITPALQRGQVVITDRYVLSSFAFHCMDGAHIEDIAGLNANFPTPDLLVLLQCSPSALKDRREKSKQTRLSSAISPEDDLLAYLTHANRCRPTSGEIVIGYHETMEDCQHIAERLIMDVNMKWCDRD
jgi:dTMP kinase